jgi:DNA gyrase subunit A
MVIIGCAIVDEGNHILIGTRLGKAIRFDQADVREMGRASRGVTGIRFGEENDCAIGLEVLTPDSNDIAILSVCENGYGKRTSLDEYRVQTRGGKGIYTIKVTDRNGPVVGICQVSNEDHIILMTSTGTLIRSAVSEVGIVGRNTQGVRLMKVTGDEKVQSVSPIPPEEKELEESESTEDGE